MSFYGCEQFIAKKNSGYLRTHLLTCMVFMQDNKIEALVVIW